MLLSGKIYYDLIKERQTRSLDNDVTFIRIEELAPFPFTQLHGALERCTAATEIFFLQEEPRNQGAFVHVWPRINSVLSALGRGTEVVYKGRTESAIPAPGIGKLYAAQQQSVIQAAFDGL